MPFGPVFAPSLGLSLLKAGLVREGISVDIHYLTIPFAEAIGQDFYCGIADGRRPALQDLAGEWLFNAALCPTTPADDERYVNELLRDYYSDALLARIRRARALVDTFLEQCLRSILRTEPQLVGFTSVFQQHAASLALARRLKLARPSTFIVFGGANCEGVMGAETVRSFPFVDAAVSGEGDVIFPEMVRRVLNGQQIDSLPGVRSQHTIHTEFAFGTFSNAPMVTKMDALPWPDYDDYFTQFRASRYPRDWKPTVFFETARGCWWGERMHCTFCGLNGATMAFRSKSPERALAEIDALARRYRRCDFQAVDNILDLRYFKDLMPALAGRRSRVNIFWETKSNLNKGQVRLLRDASITQIQPGIENLSDAVLKLMRKGVTGLQNIQLLKWCAELGVAAEWNFLWGFPGEPPGEYARLAGMVPWLTHLRPPVSSATIRLDRFSPNFFDAERLGFTHVTPYPAYQHIYRVPPSAVANLACYFTYEFREPQDVTGYVAALDRQIRKWRRVEKRSALLSVEAGEHLVLIDLRPSAREPFVVLTGATAALYRECEAVSDLWQLAKRLSEIEGRHVSSERIEEELSPLVRRGLVLRDGSRYLALGIELTAYKPSRDVSRQFGAVIRNIGTCDGNRWIVVPTRIALDNHDPGASDKCAATSAHARVIHRRVAVPQLSRSVVSVDARGRLVIEASARSRQRRRSTHGEENEEAQAQR